MLQEATKILNSAFHNSFIKRLSLYLHDCVREEVQSSTFRNLKGDKDNKWVMLEEEETLFSKYPEVLRLHGDDSNITELMIQAEMGQKDRYLIYGYLFLVGKSNKKQRYNEFLTPLLYMPCKLERDTRYINCVLQDENLSLNTGALAALIGKNDDEDEVDMLIEGILDAVPDLPLTQEKLDIFVTTLKSVLPDIEIALDHSDDVKETSVDEKASGESSKSDSDSSEFDDDIRMAAKPKLKADRVSVTNQSAIILTKRPQITAGVLHELMQISEKPSGVFRETALSVINDEYVVSKTKTEKLIKTNTNKEFFPITPLALSAAQEDVLRKIDENTLVSVYGPPGTGKSQTIVNLVAHLVANGKTVLVASRMDKATDVVADRLNGLGAPFLALRAGRLNYQKALSDKLQDLVAQKIDLDSDFENSIFVSPEDMKKHLDAIAECRKKIEEIISYENQWQKIYTQRIETEKITGKPQFLSEKLSSDKIDEIANLIELIENNKQSSNFILGIKDKINVFNLKKKLNLQNFDVTDANLTRLKEELSLARLYAQSYDIELKMQKVGNIHQLSEQIKILLKRQKPLAIEILKNCRRESLKGLLRDQIKRQRLIVHTKALTERKKNLQNRLLEEEDFKPLLEAFPCWGVTTYAISGSLPLKPGLFDVAIIDEASQCDIASCIPILYRAKKAVIVGDDKQLPHLSFLEKSKEQSFLSQYEIPDKYQLMWRFRTNSMFDLANYYSMTPVMLDEHFRSLKPIIDFSNKEFYGGRMRIMNKQSDFEGAFELHLCTEYTDSMGITHKSEVERDQTRNPAEAEAVVNYIHGLILEDARKNSSKKDYKPVSIGIISPFRAQVEMIKKAIIKVLSEEQIHRHQIDVGTPHVFQGDERDVIVISWTIADNSFSQSLTFLQKPNVFNVAITRAKNKQVCFLSKNPADLPQGLLRSYIEYIQNFIEREQIKTKQETEEPALINNYKNDFEFEVAKALNERGLKTQAGVELAGVSADLLVENDQGKKIIVECDGVEDNKKSNINATTKQAILTRCGFPVQRVSFREWFYSPNSCITRICQTFEME